MSSLEKSTLALREFPSLAGFYGEFFLLDSNSGDRSLIGEEKRGWYHVMIESLDYLSRSVGRKGAKVLNHGNTLSNSLASYQKERKFCLLLISMPTGCRLPSVPSSSALLSAPQSLL
jgi:hypothetical protein